MNNDVVVDDLDFREWLSEKHPVLYHFLWNQFSKYEMKQDFKRRGKQ